MNGINILKTVTKFVESKYIKIIKFIKQPTILSKNVLLFL